MATIRPFNPILPNPLYADQLVFAKPQAESVSGDFNRAGDLKPLKTLLESPARLRPETPEGQESAYCEIKETLCRLLANETLLREKTKHVYVYQVTQRAHRQTGIWAITDLADYAAGNIKLHELTFGDSVRRMKNYRENTGLEGSPILLTYATDETINSIIAAAKAAEPEAAWSNEHGTHRIWKVSAHMEDRLVRAFETVAVTYLADGHHRLEAAVQLMHHNPAQHYISSLYMAFDELRIQAYNRVVIPGVPIAKAQFLEQLSINFHVWESTGNETVLPTRIHRMGMLMCNQWYSLLARPQTYVHEHKTATIDAEILQRYVLSAIFGINDPRSDQRLKCAGGEKALEEIAAMVREYPDAIAFTLCPLALVELTGAADAGNILPPKSTWIDPKIPYGLLLYQHD